MNSHVSSPWFAIVAAFDASRFDGANSMVKLAALASFAAARASPRAGRIRRTRSGLAKRRKRRVKFRVEVVWQDSNENVASSIFLTSDGRVILQGRAVSSQERQTLALPAAGEMISVDRNLIQAIKDML
jgi:hypothetical protein